MKLCPLDAQLWQPQGPPFVEKETNLACHDISAEHHCLPSLIGVICLELFLSKMLAAKHYHPVIAMSIFDNNL